MTPDDLAQVADAVDRVIGQRMEQVYGTIEELRQEVADAVTAFNQTANVLNENDIAVMAQMAKAEGDEVAGFMERANDSWRRFIIGEAKQLGIKIMVDKT